MELNNIYHGDCLDIMKNIPNNSVDLVLTDPPYQITKCKWDTIIPFEPMWKELERIIKINGCIVLCSKQPFTSMLVMSNIKMFGYEWIWDKVIGTDFLNQNKKPLKGFENILIFYKKQPTYNPQKEIGKPFVDNRDNPNRIRETKEYLGTKPKPLKQINNGERHPRGIIRISGRNNKPLHPTQKPVELMEYFIKTYSNEGDVVLDFQQGSFSTIIQCINTKRQYIGIEKEEKYYNIGKRRIEEHIIERKEI